MRYGLALFAFALRALRVLVHVRLKYGIGGRGLLITHVGHRAR